MKKIAKLLKADLNGSSDLAAIAAMLTSKGRGNDTLLAHITPREAEILKAAGGSGTTNPETGLLEFFDEAGFEGITYDQVAAAQPAPAPAPTFDTGGFEGMTQAQYDAAQPAEAAPTGGYTGGGIRAKPGLPDIPAEGLPGVRSLAYQGGAIVPPAAPAVTTPSGEIDIGFGAGKYAPAPQEKSFFDKLTTQDMIRLGLAGGLGVYGATQAKKGAQQAQQAAEEQKAVGAPYQAKGKS